MAKFNAGQAVSALEYDFTTCKGVDGEQCVGKGQIPEFGDEQLEGFRAAIRSAYDAAGLDPTGGPSEGISVDPDDIKKADADLIEAIATFCQGSPSRDELAGLPWRVRQAFIAWLFGELFDPKGVRSATRR